MAEGTVIVVVADPVRHCVDLTLKKWPHGSQSAGPLRFRLVGASDGAFLAVDLNGIAAGLAGGPERGVAGPRTPSSAVLSLEGFAAALGRAVPDEAQRDAFLGALRLCLEHWRPGEDSAAMARLRADAMQACAAAVPQRPRLAGSTPDADTRDAAIEAETSLEALFRTLHFCRLRADTLA